jgi:twitching motility protein PilT
MENIIRAAVERGASDLHIKAGAAFRARIDGQLVPLTKQTLTPEQTRSIAQMLIGNPEVRERLDRISDYDCSWGAPGLGRFRVNILRQRSSFMIVMRVIPFEVPTLEKLRLPPALVRVAQAERGMVLVTGATGSGKSTTTAALINHVNLTANKHIVTLENPIEFLHRDVKSSVTQREVGVDTESFRLGVRAALRQDPDVIVIGEMRDAETIDTAMKAAETGHLLISTLHTADAVSTVSRVVAMFPPEEQGVVRVRLAESLHAVISQRLLPRADGKGRVVAAEVMIVTPAIRELMLHKERVGEIHAYIAQGRELHGVQMFTFDQHLAELVRAGEVTYEVALAAATHPSDFELQMRMLGGDTTAAPIVSDGMAPDAASVTGSTNGAVPDSVANDPADGAPGELQVTRATEFLS